MIEIDGKWSGGARAGESRREIRFKWTAGSLSLSAAKAETNKHNLVEVETTTENLGSKYVENTKFKYTEADVKDTSNVKDVVPQIVSNLKNEKANKVSNDVKVDRVQNVLYKKVEEKKSTKAVWDQFLLFFFVKNRSKTIFYVFFSWKLFLTT